MGSGIKKKGKSEWEYYMPSDQDYAAFIYCVRNNIRISMTAMERGLYPENFKVLICLGTYKKYEKPNLSPKVYKKSEIVEAMYKAMRYYYDKHRR